MADLGRATRAYVSGYHRDRVVAVRLYPQEGRALVADFNGAIASDRTIVSANWQLWAAGIASIASAAIAEDQRSTSVQLTASLPGCVPLRCQVTLDDGTVMPVLFEVAVLGGFCWPGDAPATGTTQLTVEA